MLRRFALIGCLLASGCAENGPESTVAPLPSALPQAALGASQPPFAPNRSPAPASTYRAKPVAPDVDAPSPFGEPPTSPEPPPRGDVEL